MFDKEIGIDLGTANTLVYMKGKGIIMREPSVVAIDVRTQEVRCVGSDAKEFIGRTPGSIVAVRPLKDGVIADFEVAAEMLRQFIQKSCKKGLFSKVHVAICVPSGVTRVERLAVRRAALKAGAKAPVIVIEEPLAAAIGAGLPVEDASGSMVLDIGGGTSEVAVISMNGIVAKKSVRVGGDEFDQAIVDYVKRKYNLLIGDRTAEEAKIAIGSAFPYENEGEYEVRGRNLLDGLPKTVILQAKEIREALADSLDAILEAVRTTLEVIPPELSADIIDRGLTLTGGGALLRGLDQLLSKETGISVHVAQNPLDCVAIGTGLVLNNRAIQETVAAEELAD
ncbi:MAG: rod shape-determining protein [Oscillospiraceae bacterium]|nr:rod shape-determining protein [Oscillospiraceae bacterium]